MTAAGNLDQRTDMVRIMNRVTLAGCLAMVFVHTFQGAQQAEFLRDLGARAIHFGVLGAIPPLCFTTQFAAAWLTNRMEYRSRFWIVLMVLRRLSVSVLVLVPWLLPGLSPARQVWTFLAIMAAGQAMGMFGQPMFFAWMGDLLPRDRMTEFWASRRKWLSWTHALTMVAAAVYFYTFRQVSIRITYMLIVFVGSAAGVLDILLFRRIPEPRGILSRQSGLTSLAQPFRTKRFRRLIVFSCLLAFGMTTAAPFISLFMLQELKMPVYAVVALMTTHAVGGVLFASRIGRLADRVGHRPVMILSTAFKPLIVIALFFVQPGPMVVALVPILLADNMLNTTLMAARTGFMLKQSPQENRAMFIAAVLAPAGLAGAAGSLCGGVLLEHLPAVNGVFMGVPITGFRILFAVSAILRLTAFFTSRLLHEPESHAADRVLIRIFNAACTRFSLLPVSPRRKQ